MTKAQEAVTALFLLAMRDPKAAREALDRALSQPSALRLR